MASFIDPATVQRAVLRNGLTVLIRRDVSAPVVAIVTHVKAGYFDETDDVSGIAHVLEHMYFKGTEKRGVGEIARETKGSGGYLNAHTIYDQTVYYTVLPSSGFAAGLDEPPFGQTPLELPLSVAIIALVIVGSFVLGSLRLARFEIRGGD